MIEQKDWRWFGSPLHFIAADSCRFHLGTQVGNYIISTVGDYHPQSGSGSRQIIGSGRYYETYVFTVASESRHGCACPEIQSSEIDSRDYNEDANCDEVNAGHLAMCLKYAAHATSANALKEGKASEAP